MKEKFENLPESYKFNLWTTLVLLVALITTQIGYNVALTYLIVVVAILSFGFSHLIKVLESNKGENDK